MAKKTDLNVPITNPGLTGVLEQGCDFEGKLCFQGTIRINGTFKGQIFTPDTLVIGEHAKVQAEVEAGVVVINGEFQGNLKAKHRVEIHLPAIFKGDIMTPSLSVDEGVIFEGSSRMVQQTPASS